MAVQRTITIRVDEDLRKDVKVKIANDGVSLKDYIVGLILQDLGKSHQQR